MCETVVEQRAQFSLVLFHVKSSRDGLSLKENSLGIR